MLRSCSAGLGGELQVKIEVPRQVPDFSIADGELAGLCMVGKDPILTSHQGSMCAVAIKDRKKLGKGPKTRLGALYIESANDSAADPQQLDKLKEVALYTSKYLSFKKPSDMIF